MRVWARFPRLVLRIKGIRVGEMQSMRATGAAASLPRGQGDEMEQASARVAMVVEDDPDGAEVASGMLRRLGFEPLVCPDAHRALYALAEGPPDLILLDICLPEMDGVNLLKVARRVAEAKQVPVIAASAVYPREGAIAGALRELGVNVFLSKPFTLAGLREAIGQVLPSARGAKVQAPATLGDVLTGVAVIGNQQVDLEVLAGDDHHLVLRSPEVPLPVDSQLQLRVKRREIVEATIDETEILILGQVRACQALAQGWRAELDVAAARPQRAFDRLAESLPETD